MTVPATARPLQAFAEALNQRYGNYVLEAIEDAPPAFGSFRERHLDTVTVGIIDVQSVLSRRQKLSSDLQDRTFILAPIEGELVIDQYERSSRLSPGDVLVLDSAASCSIAVEERCSVLSIELDRSAFDRFGGLTPEICARRLDAGRRLGGLLANLLSAIADNLDGYDAQDGELVSDLLVSFVGRVAFGDASKGATRRGAVILPEMRDWVRANIHEPLLSPEMLAEKFGLSRRGVYRHFAALGTTPARWLWDIRLECADERLRQKGGSISEIAFSVGFNDSGHFARLYKRRYGQPPTHRHKRN